MSITCHYYRITSAQLERLQQALQDDPEAVDMYIFAADAPPGLYRDLKWIPGKPKDDLYIGKSWQGITFLLNGNLELMNGDLNEDSPFLNIVRGNASLGGEPATYNRYFTPECICKIADELDHLDPIKVRRRFDPLAFEAVGIYPGNWEEADWNWLWDTLMAIRVFFRKAAQEKDVIVIGLC